jgi:hypothetical protein
MRTSFFATSILLTLLFAISASAAPVRESNLNGGWQVWIDSADFDERTMPEVLVLGSEDAALAAAALPSLGTDIVICVDQSDEAKVGAFMKYNFESSQAGPAFVYSLIMDYRGGGQSWYIALNTGDENEADRKKVSTSGEWGWKTASNELWTLVQGTNFVRISPREGGPGVETIADIFCVSTVEFAPTNDDYIAATSTSAVEPDEKMATMWGSIKSSF